MINWLTAGLVDDGLLRVSIFFWVQRVAQLHQQHMDVPRTVVLNTLVTVWGCVGVHVWRWVGMDVHVWRWVGVGVHVWRWVGVKSVYLWHMYICGLLSSPVPQWAVIPVPILQFLPPDQPGLVLFKPKLFPLCQIHVQLLEHMGGEETDQFRPPLFSLVPESTLFLMHRSSRRVVNRESKAWGQGFPALSWTQIQRVKWGGSSNKANPLCNVSSIALFDYSSIHQPPHSVSAILHYTLYRQYAMCCISCEYGYSWVARESACC